MVIEYPCTASIKIAYSIPGMTTQEYTVLTYTITSETGKKIFDAVNSIICEKSDILKSVSSLKFLLTLL